jgi:S-DNA-T family DNA segregation ATPase FtsK/SpoIIIE
MARAARRGRSAGRLPPSISGRVLEECLGVALLGLALLAAIALATYTATDPVFERGLVANRAGVIGAAVAAMLFRGLGTGAAVLVVAVAAIGLRLVIGRGLPPPASRFWVGTLLLLLPVSTLPALLPPAAAEGFGSIGGGALGGFLARHQRWLVGTWGALLLNGVLLAIGGLSFTGVSTRAALAVVARGAGALGGVLFALLANVGRIALAAWRGARGAVLAALGGIRGGGRAIVVWRERRARRARVAAARAPLEIEAIPVPASAEAAGARRRSRGAEPAIVDHAAVRASERVKQETFDFVERGSSGPYVLPDVSIFQRPPAGSSSYDRDSLIMNSRILEKKLMDFGVGGRVVTVHPGPVVTMYEFEPASGVKVNRIVGLSDDLALALRALSVRIIAPLPGKSVVGIEVANAQREVVYLRDVLDSDSFRSQASKLSFALGKDIFGNAAHADLARMPHLLVAGATGTGKSVFLNAMLCSLLCRATPDEIKLLLIDPKLLELSIYEGIPHLVADVVTHPKRASAALKGVVRKMEERYQMMAALGVRSIDQFNARVDKALQDGETHFSLRPQPGDEEGEAMEYRRLPYIVVVIDELADLMVVSARDVEESLQRLAQMARAAGIHLVLATQRPSVDVLTGVIKANFPARVSFQVSSRTDSRTILDQNGADHLLGQGDMLFLPPGTSKLKRMHGAYVSESEVTALAASLRQQGAPEFDETLTRVRDEEEASEARGEDHDEMYDQAVSIVADTRNASISYLQRRLKVGYNRAARMIEQMEQEGVVGPQIGTKSREVYVSPIEP